MSVLIPARNAQATLSETLQSALASSHENLEIILVDDGSTDATAAIAGEFAAAEPRVRLFRQEHRGVSAALNHGLAQVRGDFVARLDADDLWHPAKLQKQIERFSADDALTFVSTFVRYVDGGGRVLGDAPARQLSGFALCQCLYDGIIGGGSAAMFRTDALRASGGYDQSLAVWEDLLVHLKAAAAGPISVIPEYLAAYRARPGSSSSSAARGLENWLRARRVIQRDFPQIPATVRRWSDARRLLDLAEGFAGESQFANAARIVALCLGRDFARTSAFLAARLARNRAHRPISSASAHFAECDPAAAIGLSDYDSRAAAGVHAIDERRRTKLQSLDRELALLLPAR